MVEVYLDNVALEMPENTSIGLSVGIASIEDPISASASYSQTISVPMTPHNTKVFRHTEQILSPEIFNHSEHIAAVYEDGVELIKGKAYYDGATDSEYKMQIVGNEFDWLERIRDKKLNEIDSDVVSQFREYATMTDAQRKAVFFGLLDHGCWWQEIGEEKVRRQWATYSDLVPFVGLQTILQSIFKGYTINAGTISNLLTRLYVTGAWKAPENADVLAEDNAFKLSCAGNNVYEVEIDGINEYIVGGKLVDSSRVTIDPFDTIDEAVNGVITMDGESVDIDGESVERYIPYFEPTEPLNVAYKLRLKYTTTISYRPQWGDYAFADTISFNGRDIVTLNLEDGEQAIEKADALNKDLFRVAKLTKQPASLTPTDAEKGNFYIRLSDPTMYTEVVQMTWKIYSSEVETNFAKIADITSNEVHFRAACYFDVNANYSYDPTVKAAIGLKTKYGDIVAIGDGEQAWEIYDFSLKHTIRKLPCANKDEVRLVNVALYNFEDVGNVTFNVSAQTIGNYVPRTGAGLSVGFRSSKGVGNNDIIFNVLEGEIEPVFNFAKKWYDNISLNDVAGETQATDALKAIMQLFNLRVYANPDTKVVNLLPYDEFHTNTAVDWRNRIDQDKGVEITTIGDNIGKSLRLAYAEENPVVADYNKHHAEPYMSYKTTLLTKRSSTDYELNSNLNPPVMESIRRVFPNCEPQYTMLQLADDKTQEEQRNIDTGALPRTLVLIQQGGDDDLMYYNINGVLSQYVQPIFTTEGISFKDLHKHYDKQIDAWNYGKRIVCYCRVYPQEIESLRKAGMTPVDFRSRYLLHIGGEDIYCRLESIVNYEPQNATHKCTFIY